MKTRIRVVAKKTHNEARLELKTWYGWRVLHSIPDTNTTLEQAEWRLAEIDRGLRRSE